MRQFFLNVSKEGQRRRFLERLDAPHRRWKFSASDLTEPAYWDDQQATATAPPHASSFVVPADNKRFTRLIVVAAMIKTRWP